jgi:2-dehydro-3-deoxygluconokinase
MPMPPCAQAPGRRVVCFGECMVELRAAGPRLLRQSFAGDTFNTAVYLARLGVAVRYAAGVGSDRFAEPMRQAWREAGVDDSLARVVEGRSTGLYTIDVDAHGERHFSYWRDTSAARAYFDGEASPLEQAEASVDVLVLSGISLAILPGAARERLFALVQRLRRRGGWLAFDNNYRPRLWPDAACAKGEFERFMAVSDIALVTLEDAQAVDPGRSAADVLASVLRLPCAEVVVKRGAASTLVRSAGAAVLEVAPPRVERPVDTTAAGDSFAAGYLAARLRGLTPDRAASVGNRLAATVIGHPGAIIPADAMPPDPWQGLHATG